MDSQKVWLSILISLSSFTVIYGQGCSLEGQLRLTQTDSVNVPNAGRLEFCKNRRWRGIGINSITTPWSEKNAQVACIELGFSGALNSIFTLTFFHGIPVIQRSTGIAIVDVVCNGTERNLTDCIFRQELTTADISILRSIIVFIVCRPGLHDTDYSDIHTGGPQSGDIRLFGDPMNGHGAVSIYSNFGWQGICPDSSWTNSDARVICQHLGYASGLIESPVNSIVGPGGMPLPRQFYGANCPARNSDFVNVGICSFSFQELSSDCTSPENTSAAVRCTPATDGTVRLIGGDHSREGIVEIAYEGRWGVVCSSGFTMTDARSVCEGLGYGNDDARTITITTSDIIEFESNLRPIWLSELNCTSADRNLSACVKEDNVIGFADCRFNTTAGVDCGQGTAILMYVGIGIGVLTVGFVVVIFGYIFGKHYWRKRHTYGWYNTLSTPSSWRDCDCDCFSANSSRRQSRRTNVPDITIGLSPSTGSLRVQSNPHTTTTLNLTQREELHNEQDPEPIQPVPAADPGLTKAPPPSYQAASNFPTHDPKSDLPPPYPSGPGQAYAPSTALPSAPTALNGENYPPAWNEPTYPPQLPGSSTVHPYPVNNDTPPVVQ